MHAIECRRVVSCCLCVRRYGAVFFRGVGGYTLGVADRFGLCAWCTNALRANDLGYCGQMQCVVVEGRKVNSEFPTC